MEIKKIIFILVPAVLLFTVISCTNDEKSIAERSYLDEITGTYSGEITSDHNQNTVPGTAVVSRTEDDDLMIHCTGEILDTTIFMEAFLHGDSVMVCNTGNEFYQEYSHMGNGYHMTDMHMGETEWMHHLNDDHQPGDEHYGGFDMDSHAFSYSFQMDEGDTSYSLTFRGTKK